jgi:hypothetical protein
MATMLVRFPRLLEVLKSGEPEGIPVSYAMKLEQRHRIIAMICAAAILSILRIDELC